MSEEELATAVEALVDKTSLSRVLAALSLMCHEKAEHINHAWQDERLAHQWTLAGRRLDREANKIGF